MSAHDKATALAQGLSVRRMLALEPEDFPPSYLAKLEREARAFFARFRTANHMRRPRDKSRHAARLAVYRAATSAKLVARVCVCGCAAAFVPDRLGLKRVFATPQCKARAAKREQRARLRALAGAA